MEGAKGLRKKIEGSKLGDCWKKADLLLRGAFRFPLKDDHGDVNKDNDQKQNSDDGKQEEGGAVYHNYFFLINWRSI